MVLLLRPFVKADKPHWTTCDSLYDQETTEVAVGGAVPNHSNLQLEYDSLDVVVLIGIACLVYVGRREVKRFSSTSGSFRRFRPNDGTTSTTGQ